MAQFVNFLPNINQENVARTALISFSILDDGYAGQINTLNVIINATSVITNGVFVNGYNGSMLSSITKIVIGIYPKSPNYLPRAEKIDVSLTILDTNNTLVSQDYSFYTSGYGEVTDNTIDSTSSRACSSEVPSFPQADLGLRFVKDDGVGTEVSLVWKEAYLKNENNVIFYNIYYSTNRDLVCDGYPEFITDETEVTIGGLSPGDQYFFAVHAVEISPLNFTLSGLKQKGINLYEYPTTTLSIAASSADLTINVDSTIGFPNFGLIVINDEICKYSSKTAVSFLISTRGYGNSIAESHSVGSLIKLYINKEEGNSFIVQSTPTFQKPNYALTYELKDGYETSYQDGYDGYAVTDGYLRYKQENFDNITTPGQNNDASGGFHRLDYCSWRSLSPQSVMKGQCSHSYFGGAQVRFDADGNKHLVKESNIATHMLQREEALLESTGEPIVLLRRMWTGIRCHCFMLRREHPDSRCANCFGTSFVQGYVQFFNSRRSDRRILVRVDPATDDLQILDRGLEQDYQPDAWTMAYPALKDRDVLVRFNEDNSQEYIYEILNVNRVRALFGQSGAQKFKMQRFPKTDQIYQFPILRDTSPYPGSATTSTNFAPGIISHNHSIVVPDGVSLITYTGATLVSQNHNHIIFNGVVQNILGHTHTL
jgi:hypothetical protein